MRLKELYNKVVLKENIKINNTVDKELLRQANQLSNPATGFQPSGTDAEKEFVSAVWNFMKRWNIGKFLSTKKWSNRARDEIRGELGKMVDPVKGTVRKADPLQMYNDIRSQVSPNYSRSEVAVVARTEAAKLRAVNQLLLLDRAGIEEVQYIARPNARKSHAAMNGKRFKVKELLENDDKRIPITINGKFDGYNCRCYYRAVMPTRR